MTVKVSPKYQVVIPQPIRKALNIRPGTRVHVFQYGNRIEFVSIKDIKKMRGFLRGMNTNFVREDDRTL